MAPVQEMDPEDIASQENLVQALKKSGAALFRELLRLYPVAEAEDYWKAGAWQDEVIKRDLKLVEAHRRDSAAPEPPALEDIPMPKPPGGIAVPGMLTLPQPPGGITLPVRPASQPLVLPTSPAQAVKIATFIAGSKLDPLRSRPLLNGLKAHEQNYVLENFKSTSTGAEATDELEKYINECKASSVWGSGPATPAATPAATGGVVPADQAKKQAEVKQLAIFVASKGLNPARAKATFLTLTPEERMASIKAFTTSATGETATALFEKMVADYKVSKTWRLPADAPAPAEAPADAKAQGVLPAGPVVPGLVGVKRPLEGAADAGAPAAKAPATGAAGVAPKLVSPPGKGAVLPAGGKGIPAAANGKGVPAAANGKGAPAGAGGAAGPKVVLPPGKGK